MKKKTKGLLEVHAAVMLFGFAGLFGELINLPAPVIVCGRTLFAAAVLLLFARYKNVSLKISFKKDYRLLLSGMLLAIHWTTFFYAVQVSSVAIGLLAVATFPIFTLAVESYIFKKRFKPTDIVLSSLIIFAMYLIVPHIELSSHDTWGVLLGMAASFSFSLLIVFNRWATRRYASIVIVFYQDAVAAVVTLPMLLFVASQQVIQPNDIILLAVLGVIFTAFSHGLFVKGLAYVTAQSAAMIASLEPIYGILIAIPILHEVPTARTIVGGMIILAVAFMATSGVNLRAIVRRKNTSRPIVTEIA